MRSSGAVGISGLQAGEDVTRFSAFSEQAAHAAGLAPRQHQALLTIKGYPRGGEVTIGDLAQRRGGPHACQ